MDGLALLGQPDHFLIQDVIGAVAQGLDDAAAVVEVVPEPFCVEEMQFFFGITE